MVPSSWMTTWSCLLARCVRPPSAWLVAVLTSFAMLLTACGRSEFDGFEPGATAEAGADGDLPDGDLPDGDLPDGDSPDGAPSDGDPSDVPPSCERPSGLVLDPSGTKTPVGTSVVFELSAICPDGTRFSATGLATWSSNNPKVLSFTAPGIALASAAGAARVRADYAGTIAEADVVVTDDTLSDLRIDPGFADLAVGASVKLSATAFYASGTSVDVTTTGSWKSDATAVATVSAGVVTGVGAGGASISVAFGGRTAFAKVSVSGRTIKAIEVAPANPTAGVGVALPMTATALYSDGTKGDVTTAATWTSGNPTVASVGLSGATAVVKTLAPGIAEIRAFLGGVTGSTSVSVTAAKLTSVIVSPSTATVAIAGSTTLRATANYSDGSATDVTGSAVWTSSADAIAAVSGGVVRGVAPGSATVSASFGGLAGSAAITVSPARLLSIAVTPASATAPLGSKVSFKATGTYEGGAVRDITSDVTWSTDAASVASISNLTGAKGELTPVAVGATTVRARLGGLEGSAKVSVVAASITSITISPNPLAMIARTKESARATAKYSDGTTVDVTTTCTWSTASAAIATVSNASGAQGQVAAVAAGTTTLSCAQSGVTGSGTINVTAPTLETVSIAPVAPTCRVGGVLQFQATAISTAGTSTNVTTAATWASTASTIVQYTGTPGRFRCVAKGTATVSATYNGQTGSAPVTVTDAVPVSITVDPANLTLAAGVGQQYQATAILSDGTSRNVTFDPGTTWVSSAPTVAAIATAGMNKGRATALAAGKTTITATFSGLSGSTSLTVSAAKVVSVQISPPAPRVPAGVSFGFTATAVYSDGTSREVTGAATWVSSSTGVLAVSNAFGSKGNATSIAAGTATVSATFDGITGSAAATVTSAKLVQVQLTPFNPKLPVGFGVRLAATAVWDDGTTLNVTGQSTWTSANTTVASVSNAAGSKGRITTTAAGSAVISAQYNGVVGKTTATVTAATLTSIAIAPTPAGVAAGGSQQLTATGAFSDGSTLDVTDDVGWFSSDPSVADVSNAADTKGTLYGFKAGTVTVTATRGGVSGKASATVK
jgi:hypothetical protein